MLHRRPPPPIPLLTAVDLYAELTIKNGHPICFCRVNLEVVEPRFRFQYATFITAWRRWFSTPITGSTAN